MEFFSKLRIKGVRLPRDGDSETGRLKGFGYADFEDRESLIEALTMNDYLLQVLDGLPIFICIVRGEVDGIVCLLILSPKFMWGLKYFVKFIHHFQKH